MKTEVKIFWGLYLGHNVGGGVERAITLSRRRELKGPPHKFTFNH